MHTDITVVSFLEDAMIHRAHVAEVQGAYYCNCSMHPHDPARPPVHTHTHTHSHTHAQHAYIHTHIHTQTHTNTHTHTHTTRLNIKIGVSGLPARHSSLQKNLSSTGTTEPSTAETMNQTTARSDTSPCGHPPYADRAKRACSEPSTGRG